MRRKNRGGENKIRRNTQTPVCQNGKAKAWLELNTGILKVKGKAVKTWAQCWMSQENGDRVYGKGWCVQCLGLDWQDLTSGIPGLRDVWEGLEQSWFTLREVGDVVKACLKNPGIHNSMVPDGMHHRSQDKGFSQSHLEFYAVPRNGVRGVFGSLKLAHRHWTVRPAPCTEASCLKVAFPSTDSEQFKL